MDTSTLPLFTADTPVGDIVTAHPDLARLLDLMGIDYCCGGRQALAATCLRRGLEVGLTLALLRQAATAVAGTPEEPDAGAMRLDELADHIEATHHAYTRAELPRLLELAQRTASRHGEADPRLTTLVADLRTFTADLLDHLEKEEAALFPLVRRIARGDAPPSVRALLALPLRQMEAEHQEAGETLARLRALTDDFTPPADACATHRALLAGLAAFEADLHRHVHKENSILFPRTLGVP